MDCSVIETVVVSNARFVVSVCDDVWFVVIDVIEFVRIELPTDWDSLVPVVTIMDVVVSGPFVVVSLCVTSLWSLTDSV